MIYASNSLENQWSRTKLKINLPAIKICASFAIKGTSNIQKNQKLDNNLGFISTQISFFHQFQNSSNGLLQTLLPRTPLRPSHQLLHRPYRDHHKAACLVGLCATCICDHTQAHIQRGTAPVYENIKNTYSRFIWLYSDIMREFDSKLSQFSKIKNGWYARRYLQNVIVQKIEDKRVKVQETLRKARNDCLSIVNQHFDDLEAKITAEIAS